MALKRVQRIRHTTADANIFIGLQGEITGVTDTDELRVHDGTTAGGHRILTKTQNDQTYQPLGAALTALESLGISTGILAQIGNAEFALRSLTPPAAGMQITNPDGVAGNPIFAFDNDLGAIEGLNTNGLLARTAADTWASRTLVSSDGNITVTNGDGIAGNPTVTLNLPVPLTVPKGGTGDITFTANGVLLGNGTGALGVTAAGIADQILRIPGAGGAPVFGSIDLSKSAAVGTSVLAVANGGTGADTLTANNVLLGNGTSAVQEVAPGTSGNVLTSNGSTWQSQALPANPPPSTTAKAATYTITTGDLGNILYATAAMQFNLPASPGAGQSSVVIKSNTEQLVTLQSAGTDTIDGAAQATIWQIPSYDTWELVSIAGGWLIIRRGSDNVGDMKPYSGTTAPRGWVFAQKQSLSRTTYGGLFNIVGITFGVGLGDGLTFSVPDAQGRALIGVGSGSGLTVRALAATGGEETHLLTSAESGMPSHTPTVASASASGGTIPAPTAGGTNFTGPDPTSLVTGNTVSTNIGLNNEPAISVTMNAVAAQNAAAAHNTMQPFLATNFIVKT